MSSRWREAEKRVERATRREAEDVLAQKRAETQRTCPHSFNGEGTHCSHGCGVRLAEVVVEQGRRIDTLEEQITTLLLAEQHRTIERVFATVAAARSESEATR